MVCKIRKNIQAYNESTKVKIKKNYCHDHTRAHAAHLQYSALHPVPPLTSQFGVTGFAHFVQLVTIILQSHFVVWTLPTHHLGIREIAAAKLSFGKMSSCLRSVYGAKPSVTHAATGPTVMSSPRECVERLLAFHTHGHRVVPDPAWGSSAQFLRL